MGRDLGLPTVSVEQLPWLSVHEMREVDRVMIDDLGITLVRMMENAGRSLAVIARRLLGGSGVRKKVTILTGTGGNGGGGLVAARHMAVAGAETEVLLAAEAVKFSGVPAEQLAILERLGIPIRCGGDVAFGEADLVIDALLGYSAAGKPRGVVAQLITASRGARVLALDAPSGLELETGELHHTHVVAEATMTLAAPKEGLRIQGVEQAVGDLYLADISVPTQVYDRLGHPGESPFGESPIVRIEG